MAVIIGATAMREMKALIWKEWRRCRIVYLFILAAGLMSALSRCLGFGEQYGNVFHRLTYGSCLMGGLVLGAETFSPELGSRELEFLEIQPLSREKIWCSKVLASLAPFCVIALIFPFVATCLDMQLNASRGASFAVRLTDALSGTFSKPWLLFSAGCLCSTFLTSFLESFLTGCAWAIWLDVVSMPVLTSLLPGSSEARSILLSRMSSLSQGAGRAWVENNMSFMFWFSLRGIVFAVATGAVMIFSSFLVFRRSEWGLPRRAVVGLGLCFLMLFAVESLETLGFVIYFRLGF